MNKHANIHDPETMSKCTVRVSSSGDTKGERNGDSRNERNGISSKRKKKELKGKGLFALATSAAALWEILSVFMT